MITDGGSTFAVDRQAGKGRIALHSSFLEKSPLARSNFYLVGLIHLLARHGYFDLHAAGLINNGSGCLLVGPSGSGKSSLALNLVKKGWGYASDDALLIDANHRTVSVLSFRRYFYVDPDLAVRFPELDREMVGHKGLAGDKCFIDLENIWPDRFRQRFVPGKTVFCHVSGDRHSHVRPISDTDALLRLLPQSASIFFNQPFAKQQVEVLKRLVEQTACYQLAAGRDVYDDAHAAAAMLANLDQLSSGE